MNLANKITILRVLLTPFFVGLVLYYKPDQDYLRYIALCVFSIAVLTDALDGFLARFLKQKTTLGTIMDPIADKLLLITAFISLTVWDAAVKLPLWLPIIVVSRDIIIVIGVLVIFLLHSDIKISPSPLGKITTFTQMSAIISVLLLWERSEYVWNTAVFFTALSGIDYIYRGTRLMNGNNGKK
jgi:CDP-diacylglycerol--glycerol-3-phosphate 3-phosphatidyltransferase